MGDAGVASTLVGDRRSRYGAQARAAPVARSPFPMAHSASAIDPEAGLAPTSRGTEDVAPANPRWGTLGDEPMPAGSPPGEPLAELRDRAERRLNAVRAGVLALLTTAALAYRPVLTPALRLVNVSLLVPMLAWTVGQYVLWYRRPRLPAWLTIANPVVDVTAVTASMAGYAIADSAALGLKAPMYLAYFVILAARPITSSTRRAAIVAGLTVFEYGMLLAFVLGTHRVRLAASPIIAVSGPAVAPLDEGAKLLLLAVAAAIATYATTWQARLVRAYFHASRERDRLEVRLAHAELEGLKHQLQPHFLFNALNAISALIPSDPRAAQRTVHGLGELLRLSLAQAGEQEVRLERELELLGHYVAIQRLRFQDRLTVRVDAAAGVRRAFVPNLLLQPLVENAIRHGIGPRAAGGAIAVEIAHAGPHLRIRVTDDGVGTQLDPQGRLTREGVGLGNTRARLQYLYGSQQRLRVSTAPAAGFTIEIEVPYRE
jgi:signal transduction histidine kinase